MGKQVIAAGAFIFDQQNRIFLAKCAEKFQKMWGIPGGKLDFGENPIDAVKREVKEETNLDIELNDFTFFTCGAFVIEGTHVVYMDYIARCPEHSEIKINAEFSEWKFFTLDQLNFLDIIPKTKETAFMAFRFLSKNEFVKKLSPFNLGLIRKTVSVQEYQENWVEAYQWIKEKLETSLRKNPHYKISHIGSTSIQGMPSKPVIDILLEFSDAEQFKKDITAIEQLGFSYKGDAIANVDTSNPDPERHFFSYYNNEENIDYIHLHALPFGHPHIVQMCAFRDILNQDRSLAKEYTDLKYHSKSTGLERHRYTLSKKHFVAKVLRGM